MSAPTPPRLRPAGLSRRGRIAALAVAAAGGLAIAGVTIGSAAFRDDILRTAMDPGTPYQIYKPPPAPDYRLAAAWAARPADPAHPAANDPAADVFFVHATVYDGAHDWNAPVGDPAARRRLTREVLPNYAAPFARAGRLFAPRYRQGSLYTGLTLREDAREARAFAFGDVRAAFAAFLAATPPARPLILVGVDQGGLMLERLLTDVVAPDATLRARLAAAYILEQAVPADAFGEDRSIPACSGRGEPGCLLAYVAQTPDGRGRAGAGARALAWTPAGALEPFGRRAALCVNPLTGAVDRPAAPAKANLGAAAATGLEWGVRPAFIPHAVSARCAYGRLDTSEPASPQMRPPHGWADRLRPPPFNLFWADLEADALGRLAGLQAGAGPGRRAPPITASIAVAPAPIHRPR